MRTPAFVDRMDLADDAEGRVAIFAGEALAEPAEPHPGLVPRAPLPLLAVLDGPYAQVILAGVLVAVLVLGLVLSRH